MIVNLRAVISFLIATSTLVSGLSLTASKNQRAISGRGFVEPSFLSSNHNAASSGGISMFLGKGSKTAKKISVQTDTTRIGKITVPSIGIGTISWSSDSLTSLESLELQSLVNTACQQNAAFFDTAERYGSKFKTALGLGWGETEMLLKSFIDKEKQPVQIATKFTPSPWRKTPESVVEACQQSCERLGVEKIDLYQLHMPDIVKPLRKFGFAQESLDEIYWEGLAQCYHQGLVSNVGVSNYGPTLVTKCHEYLKKRGVPLASNQIAYSLLGRGNGAQETVDKCNELGVKVLAAFPFAMGLLTGKYNSQSSSTLAEGTLTSLSKNQKTKLEISDLNRYAKGDGKTIPKGGAAPLLSVMESIAKKRNKTVAQVALNYCICKGTIPIPGSRTAAQLSDNLGAMGWRLTLNEIRLLEKEADKLGFEFEGAGFKRTSEKFVGYGVEKWTLD